MSKKELIQVLELRIEALHANSAACMKENRKLKAENAGLRGSLENLQQRLRPYTPDGLVAKKDVQSLFVTLRQHSEELRRCVDEQSWKYAYDALYELDDTLDGYSYLVQED